MSESHRVIAFPFKAPAAAKALTQELPELMPVDARKYEHRDLTGGVGHNLPQEAPQVLSQTVVDVDSFS